MSKQLNLEEVLAILDANDEFKAEDHPGFNLEDWQYTSAETDYYDLEHDYSVEKIVIYQISEDKFYQCSLVFFAFEGYHNSENDSTITLNEVEPYTETVTKYKLKNENF